jgi:hypothetical protein
VLLFEYGLLSVLVATVLAVSGSAKLFSHYRHATGPDQDV